MGSTQNPPLLLRNKPLFGLDIGHGSLKVMQVNEEAAENAKKTPKVIGYGTTAFDSSAIDDGVLVKPELIASAMLDLFKNRLIGDITTRRVALTIPAYRSFSRSMQLPKLSPKELDEAVRLEAEEYIPVPLEELYLDYEITHETKDLVDLLAIAVPKKMVDSYLTLARMTGLEAVLIETTMAAAARLFSRDKFSEVTSVIIDFGSLTADISIFNKATLVTGTVPAGGLVFTEAIRDALHVSDAEAGVNKTKYGLGVSKKQTEIAAAVEPALQKITTEIRRMIRYYDERYGTDRPIGQIIMLGGGANMPGLSDALTSDLRLPVRAHDPWLHLKHDGLQAPSNPDKLMYATVSGLALTNPREVFGT
jgi:type IV pilus assembly protein PilM